MIRVVPVVLRGATLAGAVFAGAPSASAQIEAGPPVPAAILRALPATHRVVTHAVATPPGGPTFDIVVLARRDEGPRDAAAPARPLVLFRRKPGGGHAVAGRNDHVVYRRDQGGQCDPFLETGGIAVKAGWFTLENSVACGQHWTHLVTFRFDPPTATWRFHNVRSEGWRLNPDPQEDGEALVLDWRRVDRADPRRPVAFAAWRPRPR